MRKSSMAARRQSVVGQRTLRSSPKLASQAGLTSRAASIHLRAGSRATSTAGSTQVSRMSLGRLADDEVEYVKPIRWIDIIFLPFNPIFQLIVLFCVIIKATMGTLVAVYQFHVCTINAPEFLWDLYLFYEYVVDPIYGIDIFLHIVHRQVADEAAKREHMPKSALLILVDVMSIVPLMRLFAQSEKCVPVNVWPNILAFMEFFIVVEYFSLVVTHSKLRLLAGYTLIVLLLTHGLSMFILLLTYHGLCANCHNAIYDWRTSISIRFPSMDNDLMSYLFGSILSVFYLFNKVIDEVKPTTYIGIGMSILLLTSCYILRIFCMVPKLFSEFLLRKRRMAMFHRRVKRVVEETERRNPSSTAHIDVEQFYVLAWQKRMGITKLPEVIESLPRYVRVDIREDLSWPVFFHSPTFRGTSAGFQRYLCLDIQLEYKLPGERFFSGPHCYTNLYYIKSGVVQLVSADDSTSPILTLMGGTVLGDTSFFVPPLQRQVLVRCLTYCEVFVVPRKVIILALHKFIEDRRRIIKLVRERVRHAKTLFSCKRVVRGLDRTEDEGVVWIKKRWWQIAHTISRWKYMKKEEDRCELPPEEAAYHCSKYLGQLVLCYENQLRKHSIFSRVKFPWILDPHSSFTVFWHNFVKMTIILVFVLYPPNVTRNITPLWFTWFESAADIIYVADVIFASLTAFKRTMDMSLSDIIWAKIKNLYFMLDVLSTPWPERIVVLIGKPQLQKLFKFNRLIKTYLLFYDKSRNQWHRGADPIKASIFMILFVQIYFTYLGSYLFYAINRLVPSMTTAVFYGWSPCPAQDATCDQESRGALSILMGWLMERANVDELPATYTDLVMALCFALLIFLFMAYLKSKLIACLYLLCRDDINYQCFVSNLTEHYINHNIHPDLLTRLERYLECHWKYYRGMDVLDPNVLQDEPHDVYYKFHGSVAEQVIGSSPLLASAGRPLIVELAQKSRFLIMPKLSTLTLFGAKCKLIYWVLAGAVKCEYYDDDNELVKTIVDNGEMLSAGAVIFGKPSLRTYTCATDCEILYIDTREFFRTLHRHPDEWICIEDCIKELAPLYDEIFHDYIRKHRDYQKKVRERAFHARQSVMGAPAPADVNLPPPAPTEPNFLDEPDTPFIQRWIAFKAITVFINIAVGTMHGGCGAPIARYLSLVAAFCDGVSLVDITFKIFMPFYDERGLVIKRLDKCAWHYMSRGLLLDLVGLMPEHTIATLLDQDDSIEHSLILLDVVFGFAHIYQLMGYFNYLSDSATANTAFLMIVKWQLVVVLLTLGGAAIFTGRCILFRWNEDGDVIDMRRRTTCWVPNYTALDLQVTPAQLQLIYAQALELAQRAIFRMTTGRFNISDADKHLVGLLFILLGMLAWFVMCYTETVLVLAFRGNTVFQHGVQQLIGFLRDERVETEVISRAVNHYTYVWQRTKGLNMQALMSERIGVVFRQDLNFYFYKKSLAALDTLLRGGDPLQRQLSNVVQPNFYLAKEFVAREMDLVDYLYIVHRGSVLVTKNGKNMAVLTKGGIFGPLDGNTNRPFRISVKTEEHCDLLEIPVATFFEIISRSAKNNIANNPESAYDYMSVKKLVPENPYNTIPYLIRGVKTIKLPWMYKPVNVENSVWYSRWLYLVWMWATTATVMISVSMRFLPRQDRIISIVVLLILDVVHLVHFITDLFTMELVVVNNKCVYRYKGWRKLLELGIYIDIIGFMIPIAALVTKMWNLHMLRVLRLHVFYHFYRHFCRNFQSTFTPILLKFVVVVMTIHALTCGWIFFACRGFQAVNLDPIPPEVDVTIDYAEWMLPNERGAGCARVTMLIIGMKYTNFVVPVHWAADYLVALLYITVLLTRGNMEFVAPLTVKQLYFKVMVTLVLWILDMWISSVTISAIHTKFREMYRYDYDIWGLVTYLKVNGVSVALIRALLKYERMLWQRQKGNWLPAMALEAPICLRQDIFSSLYMHHLDTPSLFHHLPLYFKRQLVCRLRRIVIFPRKYIVQEGDIWPAVYFIHEGEVEKWYTDANGDSRMVSLLTQNGYFGLVPGLFPDTCYAFTYYTRTVVDMVYLRHEEWLDLLDGYPDVRGNLYRAAKQLKRMGQRGK